MTVTVIYQRSAMNRKAWIDGDFDEATRTLKVKDIRMGQVKVQSNIPLIEAQHESSRYNVYLCARKDGVCSWHIYDTATGDDVKPQMMDTYAHICWRENGVWFIIKSVDENLVAVDEDGLGYPPQNGKPFDLEKYLLKLNESKQ